MAEGTGTSASGHRRRDFVRYLTSFPEEMALGTEDPGAIVDRYCTPDVEHRDAGIRLDRGSLVAHARPARKNVLGLRVDVHDALVDGNRVAARYTLHTAMRQGYDLSTEVLLFGELAADGRLRRIVSTSRTLTEGTPQ
ncbi:nuclear transport factor 2 family protein [Kitasatospora sp. NPDC056181]|uniref:nuclear transport factor 2 family protein n=1 Tax=Kitasatospora sp. NPDC056181 TaxID=3345737 RepID=UPI0035E12EB5